MVSPLKINFVFVYNESLKFETCPSARDYLEYLCFICMIYADP